MAVRQFPPKDYFRSLVSLLSLYGIKVLLELGSARTWMQFPKARRDLFILDPSICLTPFCPPALSEPAKSTKVSLPILIYSFESCPLSLDSVFTNNNEWDLEEASLELVAYLERLAAPTFKTVASSCIEAIVISVTPGIIMPSFGSSLKSKFLSMWLLVYLRRQVYLWYFRYRFQYKKCVWWCFYASSVPVPFLISQSWLTPVFLLYCLLLSFFVIESLRVSLSASSCSIG